MKKLISILAAMALMIPCATAEISVIGGADGPTSIFLSDGSENGDVTIATEGTWHMVGGDATLVIKPAASGETGIVLQGVEPGRCVLCFAKGEEKTYLLVTVDDDRKIMVDDITASGIFSGVVTEVNEAEHSLLLTTNSVGDVVAVFSPDDTLPSESEKITIYTDGTMTRSLPGQVSVVAWEYVETVDSADAVIDRAVSCLQELVNDDAYISLYGVEEIRTVIDTYAAVSGKEPTARYQLTGMESAMSCMAQVDTIAVFTETAQFMLDQKMYDASTIATLLAATQGVSATAATSIAVYSTVDALDLPSSMYMLEYENGVGIIVGIWNNNGLNVITAAFVPDTGVLAGSTDLSSVFQ